ncbi:MAG TPA: hypothetical protein VI299_06545 [Polyangiales bacterium]
MVLSAHTALTCRLRYRSQVDPLPPPMDDEERAFRAAFGQMVDWFRIEQSHQLLRAFLPAFLLMPLGSALVGLSLLDSVVPLAWQGYATLGGVLVTACGPLWAIAQLLRSIRADLYVAIRVDGLCVRLDPRQAERVYDWNRVLDAEYDEAVGAISVSLTDAEPLSIAGKFSQLGLPELCRRIRDARRLAVWNRLEPRFDFSDSGP